MIHFSLWLIEITFLLFLITLSFMCFASEKISSPGYSESCTGRAGNVRLHGRKIYSRALPTPYYRDRIIKQILKRKRGDCTGVYTSYDSHEFIKKDNNINGLIVINAAIKNAFYNESLPLDARAEKIARLLRREFNIPICTIDITSDERPKKHVSDTLWDYITWIYEALLKAGKYGYSGKIEESDFSHILNNHQGGLADASRQVFLSTFDYDKEKGDYFNSIQHLCWLYYMGCQRGLTSIDYLDWLKIKEPLCKKKFEAVIGSDLEKLSEFVSGENKNLLDCKSMEDIKNLDEFIEFPRHLFSIATSLDRVVARKRASNLHKDEYRIAPFIRDPVLKKAYLPILLECLCKKKGQRFSKTVKYTILVWLSRSKSRLLRESWKNDLRDCLSRKYEACGPK